MWWKIYFWIFTPTALIIQALNSLDDRGMNFLNISVVLAAIAALHAVAFDDFTIPKQQWKVAFYVIIIGVILALALSKLPLSPQGLIINLPFLPVIYAVYKLGFKRRF